MQVPAIKGFTGTLDQDLVPTWHHVLWLGRGVKGTVGLANKDMLDAIFNPMESGVPQNCVFQPAFLSRNNPHIAHLPGGKGQVIFWRATRQLKVRKTGPPDADATVRFALGGVTPPTRPATAWQLIALSLRGGPRSKQNWGRGLWHVRVTCRCAFGVHPWLRAHIACHFPASLARILHEFHIVRNFQANVL